MRWTETRTETRPHTCPSAIPPTFDLRAQAELAQEVGRTARRVETLRAREEAEREDAMARLAAMRPAMGGTREALQVGYTLTLTLTPTLNPNHKP